jgi:type IV pilus assembly protein PilP
MKHKLRLVIMLFMSAGLLVGCSEETSSTPASVPAATSKPPETQVKPPSAKKAAKPKVAEKAKFLYKVEDRRDPFVPLTEIRKPGENKDEPETPLQQYDLAQYRLIGVIMGVGEPRAMVVAPDRKSYVLSKGIKIGKNHGVVVEISEEVIRVEETFYDFSGNVRTSIQEIVVPKRKGV